MQSERRARSFVFVDFQVQFVTRGVVCFKFNEWFDLMYAAGFYSQTFRHIQAEAWIPIYCLVLVQRRRMAPE